MILLSQKSRGRMASVAIVTTEHDDAGPGPAKLPQGWRGLRTTHYDQWFICPSSVRSIGRCSFCSSRTRQGEPSDLRAPVPVMSRAHRDSGLSSPSRGSSYSRNCLAGSVGTSHRQTNNRRSSRPQGVLTATHNPCSHRRIGMRRLASAHLLGAHISDM